MWLACVLNSRLHISVREMPSNSKTSVLWSFPTVRMKCSKESDFKDNKFSLGPRRVQSITAGEAKQPEELEDAECIG